MSIYDKASLVLIPSGTKTSKVYSQKPVSGDGDFTFSRSTAATRVNADGNIEKETQNLLLQSNSFDTTWGRTGTSVTSGQAGYDGTNNAWLLDKTATGYRFIVQGVTGTGIRTLSVYAKAGTLDVVTLFFRNGTSNDTAQKFNLTSGTLAGTGGVTNFIHSSIEDVGNGWYRCSLTYNHISGSTIRIYPDFSEADAGNIYIQDAQLEQGLVARDYIETTTSAVEGGITDNVPRLDYTDASCPSLLLEPQRSNLVPFSEHLESSDWAKTRCTIEDNSTTSPEGVINASKMTSTDASESYIQDNLATTGTKITWSFFAKKGDLDYAHGLVWDLSANGCRQWFNLSTGAVGGTTTFGSGYSVDSATIEDYGNGWYRCAMVVNSTAGTQGCRVNISSADTTITSAVNSYGYFYGIQLEDASYATSLIPTYGSAVTRNAETCLDAGNADTFNDSEGVFYTEISTLSLSDTSERRITISNTSNNSYLRIQYGGTSGTIYLFVYINGVKVADIRASLLDTTNKHKVAIRYGSAGYSGFVDGVLVETDTYAGNFVSYPLNSLDFYQWKGNVKQLLYIPTALTDQEAIDLTTI